MNPTAAVKTRSIRLYLGSFFALFLLANVVLVTLAAIAGVNGKAFQMPELAPAARLLIFAVGLGISWTMGRYIYMWLLQGETSMAESITAASVFVFYFLFLFTGVAFLGALGWLWLAIGLLILLVVSVVALWRLLGGIFVIGAIIVAAITAWLTFYMMQS